MKTRTLALATVMLAGITVGANAQSYFSSTPITGNARKDKIVRNYLACLSSSNEGTIESALAHVAALKLGNPRMDLSGFEEAVTRLSREGATPLIRYKAYLTGAVLENIELFSSESGRMYNEPDEMYLAVSSRLSVHARFLSVR
jgi:hypothetical protein